MKFESTTKQNDCDCDWIWHHPGVGHVLLVYPGSLDYAGRLVECHSLLKHRY